MVNFEDIIDEFVSTKRAVSVSIGNSEWNKGIIIAKGEDYILLFGKYETWTIPIAKIGAIREVKLE